MRVQKHLAFLSMAVAAAAIVVGVFSWGGNNTQAASVGSATFTMAVPTAPVAVSAVADVPISLSSFTPGISTTWGGYDLEISYDATVVTAGVSDMAGSNPCGAFWANNAQTPTDTSGCAFQTSTYTGPLETAHFTCIANGTSPIAFVVRGASPLGGGTGTALFDQNAVDFDMTFVGQASITCGNAAPATPTNTVQANTPTATNTPAATATPTNTVIPATATARAAATQTAQNNFGGANTATPTPGGETATPAATDTPSSGGGSPVPTTPGGGQGGAVGTPTKPGGGQGAGITGPNTGTGGAQQGGNGLPAGWLIIGGIMLALTGGGLYVRSRKVQ